MRITRAVAVLLLTLSFTATLYARHRSAPVQPVTEVEGVLKSIDATQLVVTDEKGNDVTMNITQDTIFRSGDTAVDPSTLQTGDSVEVKAVQKDNALDALLVRVDQNTPEPQLVEVSGVIKSISDTEIVVTDAKLNDTTFEITPDTIIKKSGKTATTADLASGMRVEVKGVQTGTALNALSIKVEDTAQDAPQLLELNGVVKSVSDTQLVVTNAQGKDFTLDITDQTIIRKNGKTATAADLATGDRVEVKVLVNGTSDTAIFINAEAMPPSNQQQMEIKGAVSATGSGQITVTTKSGDVVVQIDSNTKIRKGDRTISAGDIAVGDQVEATGTRVDATTMLAKKISVESGD